MNSLTLFSTAAAAHVLAVMSPGPDFAVVTRQTLAHGRSAGLLTALGIAVGIVFHVAYALFGLGWLLQKLPMLLELLRYGGALFLLWMGFNAVRSTPAADTVAVDTARPDRRSFAIGLTTNLLNPKATLFFVALCSTLITSGTPLGWRFALAAWIVVSTGLWFSLVALMLGHPAARRRLAAHAHRIDQAMGVVLIVLGLSMLAGGLALLVL
ncbi:MAG: LysE family transporter [Stagnimonas sp.]|nr:LysE family transporter [Stagnimonas sp.]